MNHTVLHFHCGENAAVGSTALTAHRAVIHYRLTLRVIRPRAHNPASRNKPRFYKQKAKADPCGSALVFWLRRWDLNHTTSGL